MYSVSQGKRPDTSEESLPLDIPHRTLMMSLMECGWAQNPDERPSFSSELQIYVVVRCAAATYILPNESTLH